MITRMDRDIGRLMSLLKELKLDENTLVFLPATTGRFTAMTSSITPALYAATNAICTRADCGRRLSRAGRAR
jgi:hypothetical protein